MRVVRFRRRIQAAVVIGLFSGVPACGTGDGAEIRQAPEQVEAGSDASLDSAEAESSEAEAPYDPDGGLPEANEAGQGIDSSAVLDGESDSADGLPTGEAGPDVPSGPPVCGDGFRDPATEECDDGLGDLAVGNARACDQACRVVDRIVAGPSGSQIRTGSPGGDDVFERWIGSGRHPVSGNAGGSAVVWTELSTPEAGSAVRVGVATFDEDGVREGMLAIDDVPFDADPVVAALPDGTFAVAFNSLSVDGDGLGIGLARVQADGTLVGGVQVANELAWFGQHSPDILWTGSALVVSWENESAIPRALCRRSFSATLAPLGSDECEEFSECWASRLTLSAFGGGAVRSWREEHVGDGGVPYAVVVVSDGTNTWTSEDLGLPAAEETPAVTAIDATHLLVVAGDAEGVLTASVLDSTLSLVDQVVLGTLGEARSTPSVAVTDDGAYLSWRTGAGPPDADAGWDPAYQDVWIQKLVWDGYELDASAVPLPLPSAASTWDGDQRRPALAAVPYYPSGAVVAVWEDLTPDNYVDQCPHGDVIVSLLPTPILRGGE